jgi:DUF4097 and DUF4098 domain-containing protein YvlB
MIPANKNWILFILGLGLFIIFNAYDHLSFVEISMNKASAISSIEAAPIKKDKIKVDLVEKLNSKNVQSFAISTALKVNLLFEKSESKDFVVKLQGESDEYRNSGAELKDWFKFENKKGFYHISDLQKNNNSFKTLDSLKKIAQTIGGGSTQHEKLKMTIQFPEDFQFNELNAELVSSDIEINNLIFKSMNIKTVSGDLNVKDSQGYILEVATVSGNSHLQINKIKKANLETVSGETLLVTNESDPNISFESVSGNLKLKMPKDSDIEVNFQSMSGVLKNEFGMSKKAATKLEFSSLSGNAEVSKSTK